MAYWYFKDKAGLWRWRLRADNNEIIAVGESYRNKQDCLNAIELVKASKNAPVQESTATS